MPQKKKSNLEQLQQTAKQLEDLILNSEKLPGDLETGVAIRKLNYRELLFVMHLVKDASSITRATTAAGYADPNYGYRLLEEAHIQQELERRTYALQAVQAITRDNIQAEILTILQDCKSEKATDKNIQLKCIDMICKINGYYALDTQVNIQNNLSSIKIEIVKNDASES